MNVRLILTCLTISVITAQSGDRLRLIHADILENVTDSEGKAVQHLRGNVKIPKKGNPLSPVKRVITGTGKVSAPSPGMFKW